MSFFSLFPTILDQNGILLTDITIRTKFKDIWLNNNRLYYSYNYQDHDRPEDIAHKYYGDQGLGWIILFSNRIINPNFELPLSSQQFQDYLNQKYYTQGQQNDPPISGADYAMITVDPVYGYQKQVTLGYSYDTIIENYVIDEDTYNNLIPINTTVNDPITGESIQYSENARTPLVMIYDTEFQNNENKREIKILKKEYVYQAKNDLLKILNQ